jgi:hypothetical protein
MIRISYGIYMSTSSTALIQCFPKCGFTRWGFIPTRDTFIKRDHIEYLYKTLQSKANNVEHQPRSKSLPEMAVHREKNPFRMKSQLIMTLGTIASAASLEKRSTYSGVATFNNYAAQSKYVFNRRSYFSCPFSIRLIFNQHCVRSQDRCLWHIWSGNR